MKKVRTSADGSRASRVHLDISEANHVALIKLGQELGLSVNQAINYVLNWARTQGTLTPASEGWRGEP